MATVLMLICEIVLIGILGAKVSAPFWFWLVYAGMVAGFLEPLISGFIAGYKHGQSDSDD